MRRPRWDRPRLLASTGWFDLHAIEKLAADHGGTGRAWPTPWQLLMLSAV